MLPAIDKVVSIPVDFICQDAFWIMPRSFEISLSGCDENITFVIGIKRHLFYPGHSLFVKAEIHLCPELHGCSCLSPDNRTDVGLADTDDPVRNRVHFIFIHVLLLFINLVNHGETFGLLLCQFTLCLHKLINVFSSLRIYWSCWRIALRIFLLVRFLHLARFR